MYSKSVNWKRNKQATVLLFLFFICAGLEIIAEYFENNKAIWLTKPLLIPLLTAYYIKRSKKTNWLFVFALFFGWIANVLFINTRIESILFGVLFFISYRIVIIYIIVRKVKMPNLIPLILAIIPFVFIYASVTIFTYSTLKDSVYLFLAQGIFTIFLGAFSLGNYILVPSKQNSIFLISTLLMTFCQFLFLLKFYYENDSILQALAMVLFVLGQFLLTQYMFHLEKHKSKIHLIKNLIEV